MENKVNSVQTLLDAAVATGVIACPAEPSEDGNTLAQVAPRIKIFTKKVKGRVTLFLGAAISTFEPAQLPMWNDFVELLWTSSLKVATSQTNDHTGATLMPIPWSLKCQFLISLRRNFVLL
jgi:hypothetical protein